MHSLLRLGAQQVCQISLRYLQRFRPHAYVKYKVVVFFSFFLRIFLGSRTARTGEPILMNDGLKRVFWREEVHFGGLIENRQKLGAWQPKIAYF